MGFFLELLLSSLTLCTAMNQFTSAGGNGFSQVNILRSSLMGQHLLLMIPIRDLFCLLLQSTEQVTAFCRSLHDMNPSECLSSSPSPDSPFPSPLTPRQLSDADKLRKVICELVETERTYVKVSVTHFISMRQLNYTFHFCADPSSHLGCHGSYWTSCTTWPARPVCICLDPSRQEGTQLLPPFYLWLRGIILLEEMHKKLVQVIPKWYLVTWATYVVIMEIPLCMIDG